METKIAKFDGIAPRFEPNLKEGFARTAQNIDLSNGKIRALAGHLLDTADTNLYNSLKYYNAAWERGNDKFYCPWKINDLDLLFYLTAGVLKKKVDGTEANVGQTRLGAPSVAPLTVTKNLTDGITYKWTASGSGTNEYYCELIGDGDPSLDDPDELRINAIARVKKVLGSLTVDTWGYGDNDALGFSTIYARLTGGGDPDAEASDYIQHVLTTGVQKDLCDGTYAWYLSGHGTNEYRLTKPGTDKITNGTFDSDLAGWTDWDTGTGLSLWMTGKMELYVGGGGGAAWREQAIPTVAGQLYRLTFDVSGDDVSIKIGSPSDPQHDDILPVTAKSAGSYTVYFTALDTITYLGFWVIIALADGFIDNVVCKPLEDSELDEPNELRLNSLTSTKATVGSLAASQWAYGNNDGLTYNTIYVRLADGTDPDTKASWYVNYILYPLLSGTYNYLLTTTRDVNGHIDESGPSAVSQDIVVVNEKIRITKPTISDTDVTYWNIYRLSLATGEYQLVASVLVATTTYDDNLADADLGDAITTWYTSDQGNEIIFDPPASGLDGLIQEPHSAMLFVWDGPTLRWSEPGYPDAWPSYYSMNFSANIKRVLAFAGVVAVLTEIGPFRVDGTNPEALTQSKVLGKEPCPGVAACVTSKGIAYLSDSGIVLFNLVDTQVISDANFTEQWFKDNVTVSGAHMVECDTILRLFHSGGTLVVDGRVSPAIWTTLDLVAYASTVREDQGEVYVIDSAGIKKLHGSTTEDLTWTWKTGDILFKTAAEKELRNVEALGSGTVSLSIYADDVLKATKSLNFSTERGRRLGFPEHTRGRAAGAQITGTGEVTEMMFRAGDE